MKKFVVLVNNGLYNDKKNVFSREELKNVFEEWSGGSEMIDEDDNVVSIDDLIDCGSMGEKIDVYNENMVEMGDEYVSIGIVELEE